MFNCPRYYLPEGTDKPSHLPAGLPGKRYRAGYGPDKFGGVALGGDWTDGEPGWQQSSAGWWVNLFGVGPAMLRRSIVLPHAIVERTDTGTRWLVPRLLEIQGDGRPGFAITERRDYAWTVPEPIRDVCDHILAAFSKPLTDPEAFDLAAEILSVNYYISRHELELAGWMTPALLAQIIETAAGLSGVERVANG